MPKALSQSLPLTPAQAVERLYQAPAVLLDAIPRSLGEQLSTMLETAGLVTSVVAIEDDFEPGVGDKEVALHIGEPRKLAAVAAEVTRFLGCTPAQAAQLCWASPAVLVGRISTATVGALRERFGPLGVELDVSTPAQARFDLFLASSELSDRSLAVRLLAGVDIELLAAEHAGGEAQQSPLLAMNIDKPTADRVWTALDGRVPIRLLNQDFQRFDVLLESAPDTPELRALLVEQTGMPAALVPKVLERLPLVLHEGARHAELPGLLAQLAQHGAGASAILNTFRSFDLRVERMSDPIVGRKLLATLLGVEPKQLPSRLPHTVEGPFTLPRARWMQAELEAEGVTAQPQER